MSLSSEKLLSSPFATMSDLVRAHAAERPGHIAVVEGDRQVSYAELDVLVDRAASSMQRDGVGQGGAAAICAPSSIEYVVVFLAALRVGAAACPLSPSSTPQALAAMIRDCAAGLLFCDDAVAAALDGLEDAPKPKRVAIEGTHAVSFSEWLAPEGSKPTPVDIDPASPFNIIYSSGTTGTPKGIVQPHAMRWGHVRRSESQGYGPECVTVASTPLYSNTTLVSVIPTLVRGGTLILMRKFDARKFLELAQEHHATHAMLVPVQYRRIMDLLDFDSFDLSSFHMKTCTSAPFPADLKADVLKRWPGGLVEFYGMTEGGGTCVLKAHENPDKLHTVGQPAEGHDIRVIDENGKELPAGELGEVVGRSMAMMSGYHNLPEKTAEAEWYSPDGLRFIRTGDVGRFDQDGFMILGDRKKDMIISGGFNIYPADLEAVLSRHEAVAECAVVAAPSRDWGETPAAFVVLKPGTTADPDALRAWANDQLGRMQRIAILKIVDTLPRSPIGKVLKRELRDTLPPA
ncbi:MAG: class I adenylate-forming enzyme family protein [Hyphomonadaceae bacterium]